MNTPKILIVDDEPFNVEYLEQELEELNYATISAFNGQDALDKVGTEKPDLVLLDIMMPVMDGFEVLARLKTDAVLRDTPVIIISADNNLLNVVKGIKLGAEDYLPKPVEPTLLYARISSCLEKKHLRDIEQLYLKSLENEMDIAREIQQSFLPPELPKKEGWEIAAYFKAAHEVAGDFYDAFLLPDGNLACVIGDVCGKGIGAALFMTLFRSLIRATSISEIAIGGMDMAAISPSARLQHVVSFTNRYITETHADAAMLFSTAFIGIFDITRHSLAYINCGNEAPLHIDKEGDIKALMPTGPVLGVIPDACYSVGEINMEANDLLLAFTDGIPDALNVDNISYGSETLKELLKSESRSAEALIHAIEKQLYEFIQGTDQFDDITMLAVKRID